MPEINKSELSYKERIARITRALTITYMVMMPLGLIAIAAIVKDNEPYNHVPFWWLISLALIFGSAAAFIMGWLVRYVYAWLIPDENSAGQMRLALFAILILAFGLSWLSWKDVPTNAQIDAVHNDPAFAPAIAKMNQDHMNPDLLLAAMRNGDSGVSRYLIFAIETVGTFIGLLFLFAAYLVIYRILSYLFRNKTAPVTQTQNKAA